MRLGEAIGRDACRPPISVALCIHSEVGVCWRQQGSGDCRSCEGTEAIGVCDKREEAVGWRRFHRCLSACGEIGGNNRRDHPVDATCLRRLCCGCGTAAGVVGLFLHQHVIELAGVGGP